MPRHRPDPVEEELDLRKQVEEDDDKLELETDIFSRLFGEREHKPPYPGHPSDRKRRVRRS